MDDKTILQVGKNVVQAECDALKDLKVRLDKNFVRAVRMIDRCKGRVIITGMGKSGIIARKIAASFASVGIPSFFLHAAEAGHGDMGVVLKKDILVAISNSGETDEILRILPPLKKMGVKIFSFVGNLSSTLAKQSNVCLFTGVKKEADPLNLVPTSSTTATLAVGDALLCALMAQRNVRRQDFGVFHPGGSAGRLFLKVKDLMRKGKELPLVREDAAFKDALLVITEKKLGTALVVNQKMKITGIVTDGDVRRIIQRYAKNPGKLFVSRVKDVMTRRPKIISEIMYCTEAVKLMEQYAITVLPVKNVKEKTAGILHLHDLVRAGFAIEMESSGKAKEE